MDMNKIEQMIRSRFAQYNKMPNYPTIIANCDVSYNEAHDVVLDMIARKVLVWEQYKSKTGRNQSRLVLAK
jgi:hypothetical protein